MSGFARAVKRQQIIANYKKFAEAWRKEKAYQKYVLDSGQQLPKTTPKLGKRPRFKQWLEMVKTHQAQREATPEQVQEFKDETDLSWDEDKKPEGAGDTNG